MTRKEIEDIIVDIVSDKMGKPKEEVSLNALFMQDLGADSLLIMEIMIIYGH